MMIRYCPHCDGTTEQISTDGNRGHEYQCILCKQKVIRHGVKEFNTTNNTLLWHRNMED